MFLVYKLTSPSGKVYIGFTGQSLQRRINDHKNDAKKKRRKIHHAINKYPLEDWHKQVLFQSEVKQDAFDAEVKYIKEYDSINTGYNHSIGGAGSPCHVSLETRALISQSNKGRKHTEEWKKNHSMKLKGRKQSEHQKKSVAAALSKTYQVTFPDGTTQVITNLRQFCIKHGLSQGSITTFGHTKGFKAEKL